jgi:hypothetical protein
LAKIWELGTGAGWDRIFLSGFQTQVLGMTFNLNFLCGNQESNWEEEKGVTEVSLGQQGQIGGVRADVQSPVTCFLKLMKTG